MRENLWLNLTDGSILCGRRYFDGSGGNNHAVEHYRETGYPLAVKLGTITPDGAGTTPPHPRRPPPRGNRWVLTLNSSHVTRTRRQFVLLINDENIAVKLNFNPQISVPFLGVTIVVS